MSPPSYSREEIDRAAWDFQTGTLMIKPDAVPIYGQLTTKDNVIMFPEVDVKSRWRSERDGILKLGFSDSDELKILSRLHHENILHFMGYCDEEDVFLQEGVNGDKVILVYKNESYSGSVADYLQNKNKQYDRLWEERLLICKGVANGLNYLHSGVEGVGRVIHNDMQSKNIMLDDNLDPKIMGFYHSVIVPENQQHAQNNFDVHAEDNPDPIYNEIRVLDTKTDVYSYGIFMFEMLIGMAADQERVFGDYKPRRLINIVRHCYANKPEQMIDPDLLGYIDRSSFQTFKDIAYKCVSFNLEDRPTMDEVVNTIKKALDIHEQAPSPIAKSYHLPKQFDIPIEYIKKATSNFKEKLETGNNSSTFYKGYLNDGWDTRANRPDPVQNGPVVVKKCNESSYTNEREIASRLRKHENHINLIGYCDEEKILIYKCVDNGSLSSRLHELTWAQRLEICIGAAKGLKYLHSGLGEYESVIHGRFSSENILISKTLETKICGLGSSFLVNRNYPDTKIYKKPVGNREMDPVYRETYIPKVESDVYSLGVVLFDILTGKLVDTKWDGNEELILMALVRRYYGDGFDKFIDHRIRDEVDVRSLHIFKQIAYKCISYQIKDRPSMNKIIKRLEEALYIQNHRAPSTATGRGLQHKKLEDFLIPLSAIKFIEVRDQKIELGTGGFGKVYKGQLHEPVQNRTVAIKCLGSNSGKDTFHNELNMIFRLSHENIIPFIGYCDEGEEKYIVYEYASNGSLDYHLEDEEKICDLTWEHRLKICLGAARGLDYLHSDLGEDKRVIHRDVKSGNILLDHNYVAKVCDFGLSKSGPINQQDTQVYTNIAGTDCYMDPVYHESGVLRKESDVYSFGVVMFELLSGMLAYNRRRLEGDELKPLLHIVRRYYASKPESLIDPVIKDKIDLRSFNAFREVAFQCIGFNSKERPTMEAIADRVEEALDLQVSILFQLSSRNSGFQII